ncbi:hypothetical protein HGE68_01190 [Rhodobacteraceae bacterium R_SAG6]|nr:hypothetical protein [Rhodobacteraceae bacterium R_SAG6]
MDIEIEREVHKLALDVIVLGRLLAEEWHEVGLVPKGSTKSIILEALRSLRERNGLEKVDRDLIELMGEQIRKTLNEIRDGKGDAAVSQDVDLDWEQNQKVIEYVNLAYRWRKFRNATTTLNDKLAAIRDAGILIAKVTH